MSTANKEQPQEIEDILSEIESLQQSLRQAEAAQSGEPVTEPVKPKLQAVPPVEAVAPETVVDAPEEPAADPLMDSMEDILGRVENMSGSALLDAAIENEPGFASSDSAETSEARLANVESHSIPEIEPVESQIEEEMADAPMQDTSSDGCLTMTLNGKMTLKLNYESGGKSVTVSFNNENLVIQLSDGAEFKIPVGDANNGKKLKAV